MTYRVTIASRAGHCAALTCTRTCTHALVHLYMQTLTHSHSFTHMNSCAHVHACTCTHNDAHTANTHTAIVSWNSIPPYAPFLPSVFLSNTYTCISAWMPAVCDAGGMRCRRYAMPAVCDAGGMRCRRYATLAVFVASWLHEHCTRHVACPLANGIWPPDAIESARHA